MLKTEFDWLKASKTKWHPRAEKVYRKLLVFKSLYHINLLYPYHIKSLQNMCFQQTTES